MNVLHSFVWPFRYRIISQAAQTYLVFTVSAMFLGIFVVEILFIKLTLVGGFVIITYKFNNRSMWRQWQTNITKSRRQRKMEYSWKTYLLLLFFFRKIKNESFIFALSSSFAATQYELLASVLICSPEGLCYALACEIIILIASTSLAIFSVGTAYGRSMRITCNANVAAILRIRQEETWTVDDN